MKVLIIVPRWFIGDIVNYRYMFPLGLAYISSSLKQAGHFVECLNINHYAGSADKIIVEKMSKDGQYDLVCTGGISTFYNQIKNVIDTVRRVAPKVKILLGGGIISSEPKLIFNNMRPDYAVLGEGEKTVVELMDCLSKKGNIETVKGVAYSNSQGKYAYSGEQAPIGDIDALPYPDFEAFEFERYLSHQHPSDQFSNDLFDHPRPYPIICSRSCPFLCTFCFHPLGNKYRQRSIDSIMRELEINVKRYKINIISIYDELFSNNREWVFEFCRRIKELRETLSWDCRWGCQMRVDRVDDEMLCQMKNAGCYMVSYGFESYSPEVLKSMKKHITPEQIDRAVQLTLKNGISIQGNFIFGDVAETRKTAETTLNYWKKHVDAGIILTFINPYPGTEIYNRLVARGVIKDKVDFIANHIFDIFNMSEKMSDSQFGRLWFEVLSFRLKYRIYAKTYKLEEDVGGTVKLKTECPHCKQALEYRNFYVLSRSFLFIMLYCRNCRKRFYVGSRLYILVSRFMIYAAAIMPGIAFDIYKKIWSFLKRHDPRFTNNRFSGLLGKLSDGE